MFAVTKVWYGFQVVDTETGEVTASFPRVSSLDDSQARANAYASELSVRQERLRQYR